MKDYTYQDMLKMQEEAAARVREMQKRATLAIEESEPKPKHVPIPDEVKHISYPAQIELPTSPSNTNTPKNTNTGIIDYLKNDKDTSLILPLVLLLGQERNDYLTSLALLYLIL